MAPNDTPPASPSIIPPPGEDPNQEEDDDETLDDGDAIEVIDLDEMLGDPPGSGDEQEDDNMEGEGAGLSGGPDEPLPEDNSEKNFEGHNGSKLKTYPERLDYLSPDTR